MIATSAGQKVLKECQQSVNISASARKKKLFYSNIFYNLSIGTVHSISCKGIFTKSDRQLIYVFDWHPNFNAIYKDGNRRKMYNIFDYIDSTVIKSRQIIFRLFQFRFRCLFARVYCYRHFTRHTL